MMLISTTSNPANGGRFYSDMSEKTGELGLNYSIPVGATKIKAGGLYNSRTRDFSARVLAFKLANAANYTLVYQPIDSIFREENMGPQGFQIDEITNENDRYDASEHVSAGYAMADIPFGLAGAQMRFIGGARVERSSQSVNSTYLGGGPVHYNRVHTDVLPSINLVYSVTESLNIRAAASQTVTRPEFREIAPFSFYDFELNSLIQGDTNIDRALITNLDFRAEFFPTAGELVSLSLFHKRFEGAIEATNEGSNNVRSWANSKNPAINYGFEIEIRKNLDFITRALADFVFTANYSYIVSRVDVKELTQGQQDYRPMQGQSPYTINLGLLFTEPELGTSASVLYNTFGKRIAEVNFYTGDLYEFPRNVVDFTLSQKLWSNIELKYSAKDILAETQYFANEDFDKSKINPSLAPEKNPQGIYDRSNKRSAVHVISITYKF
jgi:TonB-dependent receptor